MSHPGPKWRHSSEPLDVIRMQADKVHAQLTDYSAGDHPSVLAKCIYLNEASKVYALSDVAREQLQQLREEIAVACGIVGE